MPTKYSLPDFKVSETKEVFRKAHKLVNDTPSYNYGYSYSENADNFMSYERALIRRLFTKAVRSVYPIDAEAQKLLMQFLYDLVELLEETSK